MASLSTVAITKAYIPHAIAEAKSRPRIVQAVGSIEVVQAEPESLCRPVRRKAAETPWMKEAGSGLVKVSVMERGWAIV